MATAQRHMPAAARDVFRDTPAPAPGFMAQLGMVLFQPGQFFASLNRSRSGQRWLWVAVLILLALALSAIQQSEQASTPVADAGVPFDMPAGPGMDMPFPPQAPPPAAGPTSPVSPASTWMTGLTTAATQIVHWAVMALMLAEVSMFNGRRPRIGTNLQIMIWASLPLALMAVIQMIFIAGGGSIGRPGLTGFLESWSAFAEMNIHLRSFLHGLAAHLTLFWLWSLALLYIAARQTLRGRRPVVMLVIAAWVVIVGVGSGIQSYRTLSAAAPAEPAPVMEPVPGDGDMLPGERPTEPPVMEEALP